MQNASYIALSWQSALKRKLDVTANNIANTNTAGFKGDELVFQKLLAGKTTPEGKLAYVTDVGTATDFRAGSFSNTGAPLDLAIEGDGFFPVQTPDGVRYTRNGQFSLSGDGTIVSNSGYPLLANGSPIRVPAGAKEILVTPEGSISTDQGNIGKIVVQRFDAPQNLVKEGNGLFKAPTGTDPKTAELARVLQGMKEESNVNAVVAMTDLLEVSKAYTTIQKLMDTEHERLRSAISKLGKPV
jgi:flagellar basal-body rod protein FlgF